MVVALRVEIALHDILFVVPIVCACPAAWGVRNLHQTAAVEEEPCPSAVGSMSLAFFLYFWESLYFWGFVFFSCTSGVVSCCVYFWGFLHSIVEIVDTPLNFAQN